MKIKYGNEDIARFMHCGESCTFPTIKNKQTFLNELRSFNTVIAVVSNVREFAYYKSLHIELSNSIGCVFFNSVGLAVRFVVSNDGCEIEFNNIKYINYEEKSKACKPEPDKDISGIRCKTGA